MRREKDKDKREEGVRRELRERKWREVRDECKGEGREEEK